METSSINGYFFLKEAINTLIGAIFQVRNYAEAPFFLRRERFIVASEEGVSFRFGLTFGPATLLPGVAQRAWPEIKIATMDAMLRHLRKLFLMERDLLHRTQIIANL